MRVLAISAAIEIATGIALIAVPRVVAALLLGAPLDATGIAVARVAGTALLSLGLICWTAPASPPPVTQRTGLLIYNLLVAVFLAARGVSAEPSGPLLWPAVALHAVIALLFLRDAAKNTAADR